MRGGILALLSLCGAAGCAGVAPARSGAFADIAAYLDAGYRESALQELALPLDVVPPDRPDRAFSSTFPQGWGGGNDPWGRPRDGEPAPMPPPDWRYVPDEEALGRFYHHPPTSYAERWRPESELFPGKILVVTYGGKTFVGASIEEAISLALADDPECVFRILIVPPALYRPLVYVHEKTGRTILIGTETKRD